MARGGARRRERFDRRPWGVGYFAAVIGQRIVHAIERFRDDGPEVGWRRIVHRLTWRHQQEARLRWRQRQVGWRPSDREFFAAMGRGAPRSGPALRTAVAALDETLRKRFAAGLATRQVVDEIAVRYDHAVRATIERADTVLAGELSWLVPGYPDGTWPPPWHAVFGEKASSGAHWPARTVDALDERAIVSGETGDVRLTWELNRHQWLGTLARAWLYTGQERYADAVVEVLLDWISANPFLVGVNWMHAQEAALRLKAWMWAWGAVSTCRRIGPQTRLAVHKAMWQHAHFVARHLSLRPQTNNHLLTETCGLSQYALVFSECRDSAAWRRHGLALVRRELGQQFWEDGAPAEGSTGYHFFVLESAIELAAQCRHLAMRLSDAARQRLRAMVEFAAEVVHPDGTIPRVGDDDGGRGFRLSDVKDARDRRGVVLAGAMLFAMDRIAGSLPVPYEEALWLLGPRIESRWYRLARPGRAPLARVFQNAGFAVLRDRPAVGVGAGGARQHLVFCGGPVQLRPGVDRAHMHADGLSLVWWLDGREVFTDPGTWAYGCPMPWRAFFRHTRSHTAPQVGDRNQFAVSSQRFGVWGVQPGRLVAWDARTDWHLAGFRRPAAADGPEAQVLVERRVLWMRAHGYFLAFDRFIGQGEATVRQWFQLGPLDAHVDSRRVRVLDESGSALAEVHFLAPQDPALRHWAPSANAGAVPGWYAPRYGVRLPGHAIEATFAHVDLPWRAAFVAAPAGVLAGPPTLEAHRESWRIEVPVASGPTQVVTIDAHGGVEIR